jgi:hypothetical protein
VVRAAFDTGLREREQRFVGRLDDRRDAEARVPSRPGLEYGDLRWVRRRCRPAPALAVAARGGGEPRKLPRRCGFTPKCEKLPFGQQWLPVVDRTQKVQPALARHCLQHDVSISRSLLPLVTTARWGRCGQDTT